MAWTDRRVLTVQVVERKNRFVPLLLIAGLFSVGAMLICQKSQ